MKTVLDARKDSAKPYQDMRKRILADYVRGMKPPELAIRYGINRTGIYHHLRQARVEAGQPTKLP